MKAEIKTIKEGRVDRDGNRDVLVQIKSERGVIDAKISVSVWEEKNKTKFDLLVVSASKDKKEIRAEDVFMHFEDALAEHFSPCGEYHSLKNMELIKKYLF